MLLHDGGQYLLTSEFSNERVWGRHLLEDWRTLELLFTKQHDRAAERTAATVTVGVDGEARFG